MEVAELSSLLVQGFHGRAAQDVQWKGDVIL